MTENLSFVSRWRAGRESAVPALRGGPSTENLSFVSRWRAGRESAVPALRGGPPAPDQEQCLLAGTRRTISRQVAGAITLAAPLGALACAATGDISARKLLRALALAEAAAVPAALLTGRLVAERSVAPLGETLARRRRFVADASHELRTPLTRLHIRAQLLATRLRRGAAAAELVAELDRLAAGTRQLGEVVDDLLTAARIGSRRAAAPIDLAALAEELVLAEKARAEAREVTIELRRHGGRHLVHGAGPALRRVISALLDNAFGHTAPGGHIWVTVSGGPGTVGVTVRDDGEGLDPRSADRLFIRHAGDDRGFGLGLTLAREVVAGHGGTITVYGQPGAGAAFTVRLPAAAPHGSVTV